MPAGDSPAVEPGHRTKHEAQGGVLLLVGQHLHIGQPRGVNRYAEACGYNGEMGLLLALSRGAAKAPITSDAVADSLKAG